MEPPAHDPWNALVRSLESDRVHSAYLFSGPPPGPADLALRFARALVCEGDAQQAPCGACGPCGRSDPGDPIPLDGSGKKGPLLRHVGDHADLLWIERGADDTRVRIDQVRALQRTLRLQSTDGARRVAVVADAEWLNQEAQNALLRTLEEPPPQTSLLLVTATAEGLLATVRSRCQRVVLRRGRTLLGDEASDETREQLARLERLAGASIPDVLDWAEEYRGARAPAAAGVTELLATASAWLHERATSAPDDDPEPALRAFRTLQDCRKVLVQRNANPQMVAERALLAVREAAR